MNLRSLNEILPKLASIKGENLFFGFSLILFDLRDLEEIGLSNLHSIEKGKVKIQKCPHLCYVNTVNWDFLGTPAPWYEKPEICQSELCWAECEGYCWNNFQCQNLTKNECDSLCIECNEDHSSKYCSRCKYFNNSGICVRTCPESRITDNYMHKCISAKECIAKNGTWSIFNKTCVPECSFWLARDSEGNCIPVDYNICNGIQINQGYNLKKLIGCTHINGSLEIALQDYIEIDTLEKALGNIRNISGFLKIVQSDALTTLSFFKELKIIMGKLLWSGQYALYVVENRNLQELFGHNISVVIEHGNAFFQNNPYLCSSEIANIKSLNTTSLNNGEEIILNYSELNVTILKNNPTNVTLWWPIPEDSTNTGFTVFYIKITSEEFNFVKIRDGFVDDDGIPPEDSWNSIFVLNNTVLLRRLIPYSQYGYYIVTHYTFKSQNRRTSVKYFKTAPDDPTEPTDFEAYSTTDTMISLKWKPPVLTNGNLSHYNLTVYREEDYISLIQQRNYCIHPHENDNCVCPTKDEVRFFTNDTSYKGAVDEYYNKTFYNPNSENQQLRIQKRSVDHARFQEYHIEVPNTETVIYDLRPFTLYNFFLLACNHKENTETPRCSASVMVSKKTFNRLNADNLTNVTIKVQNTDVTISWKNPKTSYSVIVAYHVQYKRVDLEVDPILKCQTNKQIEGDNPQFKIVKLDPGKYAIRVRAVFLPGIGPFTEWESFQISTKGTWTYGILGFFGIVTVIIIGIVIWYKCKIKNVDDMQNLTSRIGDIEFNDEEELKLDDETIEIIRELGQNTLDIVFRRK